MTLSVLFLYGLALAHSAIVTVAANHHSLKGNHYRKSAVTAPRSPDSSLERRGWDHEAARATFYDVGLGACGFMSTPDEMVVALNSGEFHPDNSTVYPSPMCNKKITISFSSIVVVATIVDECPGCPFGGLDFSRGLFGRFAGEDAGVLAVAWSYEGYQPAPPPSATRENQPTNTWSETPTTTWHDSKPTTKTSKERASPSPTSTSTTWSANSTTGSSSLSSSSVVSLTSSTLSSSTPAPTAPTTGGTALPPGNIDDMRQIVMNIGEAILAAASFKP